ncbi:hypothetical protein H9P43_003141 [Blastocladiella emersonii ATCC 22665]|nr:hypothetical protein H9P43_003141 [Blastocladiella emersonii ATCC 22665]
MEPDAPEPTQRHGAGAGGLSDSPDAALLAYRGLLEAHAADGPHPLETPEGVCLMENIRYHMTLAGFPELVNRLLTHLDYSASGLAVPVVHNGEDTEVGPMPVELYQVILTNLGETEDNQIELINLLANKLIRRLRDGSLDNQIATHIHTCLQMSLTGAVGQHFLQVMLHIILRCIKNKEPLHHRAFELLEHLIERIPMQTFDDADADKAKPAMYDAPIKDILKHAPWRKEHSIPLASVFRELNLPEERLKEAIPVLLSQVPHLDDGDVPALVHNVLLLTKRIASAQSRREIYEKFSTDFSAISFSDAPNSRSVVCITDILGQIGSIVQIDFAIGTDLLAYGKTLKRTKLTPFNVALLLTVSRTKRFEKGALTHLKREIEALVILQHELMRLEWFTGFSPFPIPNVRHVLAAVMKSTESNWSLLEPLVELACVLLDSSTGGSTATSPSAAAKLANIPGLTFDPASLGLASPSRPSSALEAGNHSTDDDDDDITEHIGYTLGQEIFFELFGMHELVRTTVLEKILDRVMSKSPATSSYLDLLERMIARPHLVMPQTSRLRGFLDQVPYLDGALAVRLFCVLLPVTQWDEKFRGTVMLTLRKSMLNKREDLRELAIIAGVRLLVETQAKGYDPTFVHEVIGLLRRCLTLSAHLKLVFYQHLAASVCRCPALADVVLPILARHLQLYVDAQNKPRFAECARRGEVLEPMHWLVKCCTVAVAHATPGLDVAKDTVTRIRKVADKLKTQELEDFGIPATSHYGPGGPQQMEHYHVANIAIAAYEAVLEFLMVSSAGDAAVRQAQVPTMEALNDRIERFADQVRKQYLDAKGKKNPNVLLHADLCIVDPPVLHELHGLINAHDRHLVRKLGMAMQYCPTSTPASSSPEQRLNLARFFLGMLDALQVGEAAKRDKKDKARSLPMLAVESLDTLVASVRRYGDLDAFAAALEDPHGAGAGAGTVSSFARLCARVIKLTATLLSNDFEKEAQAAFKFLRKVHPVLRAEADRAHVWAALLVLLADEPAMACVTAPLVKEMTALGIELNWHTDTVRPLDQFPQQLFDGWGDLSRRALPGSDPAADVPIFQDPDADVYPIPLERPGNAVAMFTASLAMVDRGLREIEWIADEYKSEFPKGDAGLTEPKRDALQGFEVRLARRMDVLVRSYLKLMRLTSPATVVEPLLRSMLRVFGMLTTMLQIKATIRTRPHEAFIGLVHLGSIVHDWVPSALLHMSQAVDQLLENAREAAESKLAGKAAKGKGKGKAKASKNSGGSTSGGGGTKRRANGSVKRDDDEEEDEFADEDARSSVAGKQLSHEGDETMTLAGTGEHQSALVARAIKAGKTYTKLSADVVQRAEKFDVEVIKLSKLFKTLQKFIKRSAANDVKVRTRGMTAGGDAAAAAVARPSKRARFGQE